MKKIILSIFSVILLVCVCNPSSSMVKTTSNDWWDYNWEYRKEITIYHDDIGADLTNFPILFHNTSITFISHAQTDGDDFVFISSDGTTRYNHEIEYYNNTTGELIVWININNLSSTVDTILYLYYGNLNCTNQENIGNTWNNNYVMVQHLNENMGTHQDSTNYENNGDPIGDPDQDAVGVVDGADKFDGLDDYINVIDNDSLSFGNGSSDSPFTVGAWIYIGSNTTEKQRFVCKADALVDGEFLLTTNGSGKFAFYMVDQSEGTTFIGRGYSTLPNLNQWYYLVGSYDGSSSQDGIKLYLDGVRVDDSNASQGDYVAMENSDKPLYIGKYDSTYLDGMLDEVRISKAVRNAEWINASYLNMNKPSTFLSVGVEEYANNPPDIPIIYGPNQGYPRMEYEYIFVVTDPDEDEMYLKIDWDDGNNTGWIGPYDSGESIKFSHIWIEEGSYTIKAKLKDVYSESEWGTLNVNIPRNKLAHYFFLQWLYERFFLVERLISSIRAC